MEVISKSRFPCAYVTWQGAFGWSITVVTKTTFDLRLGHSDLANEQQPIFADEASSPFAIADLVPYKRKADVLVVGSVFAPPDTEVRELNARLRLGTIDKTVAVHENRWFTREGELRGGESFSRMPIEWARSSAGSASQNPQGVRAGVWDARGHVRLPNFQVPGFVPNAADAVFEPVGFGPIASHFPARSRLLGPGAQALLGPRWYEDKLPKDFDAAFFNQAPIDQQVEVTDSEVRMQLENLVRGTPRFVTNLARVEPQVSLESGDGSLGLPMMVDTVLIDTDRSTCTLTWRGHTSIRSPDMDLRIVVDFEHNLGAFDELDEATADGISGNDPLAALPFRSNRAPTEDPGQRVRPRTPALPFDRHATSEIPAYLVPPPAPAPRPPSSAPPRRASPTAPPPFSSPSAVSPSAVSSPAVSSPAVSSPAVSSPALTSPAVTSPAVLPPFVATGAAAPAIAAPSSPTSPVGMPPAQRAYQPSAYSPEPRQPAAVSRHGADAATHGVTAASNAAAARASMPASTGSSRAAAASRAFREKPFEIVDLLWFDEEAPKRIRQNAEWIQYLRDDRPTEWAVGDEVEKPLAQVQDRRDVQRALLRVPSLDGVGIARSMEDAIDEEGVFERPLVAVRGDVTMTFEPVDVLNVMLDTAKPLQSADKRLKDTIDEVSETTGGDRKLPHHVVDSAKKRLRTTFRQAAPSLSEDYLDAAVERALLENRKYAQRNILGGPHLRATFAPTGAPGAIPTYLPEHLMDKLPLFLTFGVRMLAEPYAQQDPTDADSIVLRVLALARTTPLRGR